MTTQRRSSVPSTETLSGKLIGLFSTYVPGNTLTVSPSEAAATADLIVAFALPSFSPSLSSLPFSVTNKVLPAKVVVPAPTSTILVPTPTPLVSCLRNTLPSLKFTANSPNCKSEVVGFLPATADLLILIGVAIRIFGIYHGQQYILLIYL